VQTNSRQGPSPIAVDEKNVALKEQPKRNTNRWTVRPMSEKKISFVLRGLGENLLSRIKEFSNNQQSMHTVDDVE